LNPPIVPESLEGWSVLHLMYRVDWTRMREVPHKECKRIANEVVTTLAVEDPADGATAYVQVLGHKGDLMLVIFRKTFDDLGRAELAFSQTALHALLIPTTSYVSIVELGMYDMTGKIHRQLAELGERPDLPTYRAAMAAEMEKQRQRVSGRLFGPVPKSRYVCFYPMNKRRGEVHNWYTETFERRAEMMSEHGKIGREYAGKVIQIISGSIGYDDWEWGVDLFADDPITFKKLIFEMRFDEASSKFAEFGPFYVGLQFPPEDLEKYLSATLGQP
jgi:peroxiredoxin